MRPPCAPSPCGPGHRAPLRLAIARALLPILLLLAAATGAVAQGQRVCQPDSGCHAR